MDGAAALAFVMVIKSRSIAQSPFPRRQERCGGQPGGTSREDYRALFTIICVNIMRTWTHGLDDLHTFFYINYLKETRLRGQAGKPLLIGGAVGPRWRTSCRQVGPQVLAASRWRLRLLFPRYSCGKGSRFFPT